MHATLTRISAWDLGAARAMVTHVASMPGLLSIVRALSHEGPALTFFVWLLLWTTWRGRRNVARRTLVRGLGAFALTALGSLAFALWFPAPTPNTILEPTSASLAHAVRVPLAGAWLTVALTGFASRGPGAWALGILGLAITVALPAGGYEWPVETALGVLAGLAAWALTGGVRPIRSFLHHIADDFAAVLGFATS